VLIRVPGVVFDDYLDPNATGMEAELGLGPRRYRRVGAGRQVLYDVPGSVALDLAGYLHDRAETLRGQDDVGSTHRRALDLAAEIRATVFA
jgi:hypothetical protein